MQNFIIKVDNLSVGNKKSYQLKDISFNIYEDEVFSVIGPNGAGKSTLCSALVGLVKPISGTIEIKDGVKIRYVSQKITFSSLVPISVLEFVKLLTKKNHNNEFLTTFFKEFSLEDKLNQTISQLSGGELQKLLIGVSLCDKPDLLILDEAMANLDMDSKDKMQEFLINHRQEHKYSILSISHNLHWVMGTTNRVLCIDKETKCIGKAEDISDDMAIKDLFGETYVESRRFYKHEHKHKD